MPDNPNLVSAHVHHYAPKGSGLSCWAECDCGEKLAGENGPIVGSLFKIHIAVEEYLEAAK